MLKMTTCQRCFDEINVYQQPCGHRVCQLCIDEFPDICPAYELCSRRPLMSHEQAHKFLSLVPTLTEIASFVPLAHIYWNSSFRGLPYSKSAETHFMFYPRKENGRGLLLIANNKQLCIIINIPYKEIQTQINNCTRADVVVDFIGKIGKVQFYKHELVDLCMVEGDGRQILVDLTNKVLAELPDAALVAQPWLFKSMDGSLYKVKKPFTSMSVPQITLYKIADKYKITQFQTLVKQLTERAEQSLEAEQDTLEHSELRVSLMFELVYAFYLNRFRKNDVNHTIIGFDAENMYHFIDGLYVAEHYKSYTNEVLEHLPCCIRFTSFCELGDCRIPEAAELII